LVNKDGVFAAELASISRVSASMLAAARRWQPGSVNAGSIPHDLVVLAEPAWAVVRFSWRFAP
jgi:hypothetical protein